MAVSNNNTFPLLNLPPELVEHVASNSYRSDLPALRLASKAAAAAAYPAFANKYLSSLSWCIFGDKNLSDMHNILSHPGLSKNVRTITVSTSPSTRMVERISVAERQNETLVGAQTSALLTIAGPDADAVSMMAPNLALIKSLISKARALQCQLLLCLNSRHLSSAGFVDRLIHDVLYLALWWQCRIGRLDLSPRKLLRGNNLNPALRQTLSGSGDRFRSLRHLNLCRDSRTSQEESERTFELALPILRAATNLQVLRIASRQFDTIMQYSAIGDALVMACRSPRLVEIAFTGMTLRATVLCQLLERSKDSLKSITLGDIRLVGSGDNKEIWPGTIRTLMTCSQVEMMHLYGCTQPCPWSPNTPFDDPKLFKPPGTNVGLPSRNKAVPGRDMVRSGLEYWLDVWRVIVL